MDAALRPAVFGMGELVELLEAAAAAPPERGSDILQTVLARYGMDVDVAAAAAGPAPRADDASRALNAVARLLRDRQTEREERLRLEEHSAMIFAAPFEGVFVHVDGDVLAVNQSLTELMRCEPEDLLGPGIIHKAVAPDDIPEVVQRVSGRVEGAYVVTLRRIDGSTFRAELRSKQGRLGDRPVRVVAVRDVTEEEAMAARLQESEQRLRDLVGSSFDLMVLSREGTILDVSGDLMAIAGVAPDAARGRSVLEFLMPSSVPVGTARIQNSQDGAYKAAIRGQDGEPIPVEIVATTSTLDGEPVRVAGLRDLRAEQRLEAERRRLELQVERTQRLDGLGVLAGGIAHDFNNILVAVLGNAELIKAHTRDEDVLQLVEALLQAGQKAAALTAQMLAYAGRGEMGKPGPIDLEELIGGLERLLSASLSKKAQLVVDVEEACVVRGDKTTLSQVFLNLLTNASDALDGQTGRIEVRARHVEQPPPDWADALGASVGPGRWVLVEVSDDGAGMSPTVRERIFEPFFTTKAKGHGLGLAACLGIVRAHHGALRVDSTPGRGTTFSLLLPAGSLADDSEVPTSGRSTFLPGRRVLVADDEALVRQQLRRHLELRGFVVTEAGGGQQALDAVKAAREAGSPFDLLMVDLTMGELDGAEVIQALRRRGDDVPVVLTSGFLDAASQEKLERGSFQAFLGKPYGVEELVAVLGLALEG